ncbi:MAG: class I SAM-dependent methyltransferase [Marinilabiliales bacterium]|nr:class I SAM-dependent methyltransferase [Marinilabiliales bacterium]
MAEQTIPDHTAVRTALWRALHLLADHPPYILEDRIGWQLVAPEENWQARPDMEPNFTQRVRAAICARARFCEDVVTECQALGIQQYILLGAGLDTFAQRRPEIASRMQLYEIDKKETQDWKKGRLLTLGFGLPEWLTFVPVDFESESWLEQLQKSGFDPSQPAVVTCTGVTMYLSKEAVSHTLMQLAQLAPDSTLVMTFMIPPDRMEAADQQIQQASQKGARSAGTPFVSFYAPEEMHRLATEAGFRTIAVLTHREIADRYFRDRQDGLLPASGEAFLVAGT